MTFDSNVKVIEEAVMYRSDFAAREAGTALEEIKAEVELALKHLREFNHVEGKSLSEVAAVAESAYRFVQHSRATAETQVEKLEQELALTKDALEVTRGGVVGKI